MRLGSPRARMNHHDCGSAGGLSGIALDLVYLEPVRVILDPEIPADLRGRVERDVLALLSSVPAASLTGLDSIAITKAVGGGSGLPAEGLYYPAGKACGARIVLGLSEVFGDVPGIFRRVPAVRRLAIGVPLYHEIGHHQERLSHGQAGRAKEAFAERAATDLWHRRYASLLKVLQPLRRLYSSARRHLGRR